MLQSFVVADSTRATTARARVPCANPRWLSMMTISGLGSEQPPGRRGVDTGPGTSATWIDKRPFQIEIMVDEHRCRPGLVEIAWLRQTAQRSGLP